MTDYFLPVDCDPAAASWRLIANTLAGRSPTVGTIRTAEKLGDAWAVNLKFPPFKDESATLRRRSRLLAFAGRLRGHAGRVVLPVPGYTGPSWAPELLTNNTFPNGTTGWTAGGGATLSVVDRVMRLLRTSSTDPFATQAVSGLTQYAPYIARVMTGNAAPGENNVGVGINTGDALTSFGVPGAMRSAMLVAQATTGTFYLDQSSSGPIAGSYWEVPYTSLARCALVDNGPNLLLQSDDFTTTWTNLNTTESANSTTAPDGTATADSIIEDTTASDTHRIRQNVTVASAVGDYAFTVALRAGTRTFARVAMRENTNGFDCAIDVNLTTGALGSPIADGTNWTNARAFSRDLGGGWWAITIVGRKANAATSLTMDVYLATALGTITYTGDGASLLYAWRATLAQSSVPTRLVQTTTTAVTTGTAQSGVGLYSKGWPVSTNDLLKEGAWIEIGGAHYQVVAPVNSDAAGLAFIQLNRPPRVAPADNAPIIVNNPLGRYLLEENQVAWDDTPGVFSELSLPFIEDVAA